MTKSVITCPPTATLFEVQELLIEHRIARIVVTDSAKNPVGIISEKDVMEFLLLDEAMRGLDEIFAKEVESSNLITIKPTATMAEAAQIMIRKNISSLVVLGCQLEGIVTKADVATYLAHTNSPHSVGQFMTIDPITVRPTQSVFAAIMLMLRNTISRVVVVDEERKPVGVITLSDITKTSNLSTLSRLYVLGGPELAPNLLKRAIVIRQITARDYMTRPPICVNHDSNLSVAANLMANHRISGLPVVGEGGKLAGIVSKTDITQAVAYGKPLDRTRLREPNRLMDVRPETTGARRDRA
jgi:CBS domain-containing protein